MYLHPITDRPPLNGRKFVIGNGRKTIYGPHRREAQSEANPLERRFHAAESGQLLPRSRRRHTDLALTTALAPSASDSEDSDSSSQYMSWPRGTANINLGKQLSRMAERMEGPKPVPFRAFVESLPTTKPPPSAWTGKTQARVDAKLPASSKGSDYCFQGLDAYTEIVNQLCYNCSNFSHGFGFNREYSDSKDQ